MDSFNPSRRNSQSDDDSTSSAQLDTKSEITELKEQIANLTNLVQMLATSKAQEQSSSRPTISVKSDRSVSSRASVPSKNAQLVKGDDDRVALIEKLDKYGFNKIKVKPGPLSTEQIHELIDSYEDHESFTQYELLTNPGLYHLCVLRGLPAKSNWTKEKLLALLNGDEGSSSSASGPDFSKWTQIDNAFLRSQNLVNLRAYAKHKGYNRYSNKNKDELIAHILMNEMRDYGCLVKT